MADGNDDPRDDLPGPAYESCEAAEPACPAERSGHVAVGDGRHMFVWGGYKVSGPGRGGARVTAAGSAPRLTLGPPGSPACGTSSRTPGRPTAPGGVRRRPLPPPRRRGCWGAGRCVGQGRVGGAGD